MGQPVINVLGEKVALGPLDRTLLPLLHRWQNDFEVYERATLRPVGHADLHGIDRAHRTGVLGLLIGEQDAWGKGYGTEATRLVLDYRFTGLGLHSVRLSVYAYNERAIRAYRRAGFREVGRWRESYWFGGRPHDTVFMDCLATEFESPALHRLLPGG